MWYEWHCTEKLATETLKQSVKKGVCSKVTIKTSDNFEHISNHVVVFYC